jgi:thioesterase domain-containing protein
VNAAAVALQEKIHRAIPLSAAMGYRILELDATHILVEAPLPPNINIHGTGFAGSVYSLGMLSAWALASHLIDQAGLNAELVVAEASIRYRAPIRGTIRCSCRLNADQGPGFVAKLSAEKRSRIDLEVAIGTEPAAVLQANLCACINCSAPEAS